MNPSNASTLEFLRALSNEKRLLILEWLLDPVSHFPVQADGDLVEDGVCLGAIVRKMGVSQPTITGHMRTLTEVGLVSSKRIKNWVFFKPQHDVISEFLTDLSERFSTSGSIAEPPIQAHSYRKHGRSTKT